MGETPDPQGDPLQFEKAEFADPAAAQAGCTRCHEPISGTYYEANGNVVCSRCQAELRSEETQGGGAGRLVRAALFGGLAAALGSALYYGVRALTGMEFGLIAIVVGVMVGGAVRYGARGRGGWLYQGLAMFLTYASIVSTYVPMIAKAASEQAKKEPSAEAVSSAAQAKPAPTLLGLVVALALLTAFVLAVPFLGGFQNIMGIIIIGIGLYEAWKINRRVGLVITGPYQVGSPPKAPAAG